MKLIRCGASPGASRDSAPPVPPQARLRPARETRDTCLKRGSLSHTHRHKPYGATPCVSPSRSCVARGCRYSYSPACSRCTRCNTAVRAAQGTHRASNVGHVELPEQMIERLDGLVLGGMIRIDARRDGIDDGIVIGACEEWDGEPRRGSGGRPGGRLHHPMDGRAPPPVRPHLVLGRRCSQQSPPSAARAHAIPPT